MKATLIATGRDESIDIPLIEESNTPIVSSDLGKPEATVRGSGGSLLPRTQDRWSSVQNVTLSGRFFGDDAYTRAIKLHDILQSDIQDELVLEIPLDEYDDMTVMPSAGDSSALEQSYNAGTKDSVDIQLALTRVSSIDQTGSRVAETPTSTGTGPVELRVDNESIALTNSLDVTRSVGRPNDVVRRRSNQNYPVGYSKPKTTTEDISLTLDFTQDLPAKLNTITGMFEQQFGRGGATLDFNGKYGLGEFEVLPTGSAPFRQVRQAGEKVVRLPTLDFQRIFS